MIRFFYKKTNQIVFQKFDIYGAGSSSNEPALLAHVNATPDGRIVLMAVFDSGTPCGTDCQTSLGLIGATKQGLRNRGEAVFSLNINF